MLHLTFQFRNQCRHIRFFEANLIHNNIGLQGGDLLWERRVIPVKVDLPYLIPAAMRKEGFGSATAHIDHLKAILHKHGNKICPNFTFASNNNSSFHKILLLRCRACEVYDPSQGRKDCSARSTVCASGWAGEPANETEKCLRSNQA